LYCSRCSMATIQVDEDTAAAITAKAASQGVLVYRPSVQ
jgi:hypothetical protein